MHRPYGWIAALALAGAIAPAGAPLAGQARMTGAALEAALERDPAQAEVRIRYRVRRDSASASLPVAALPVAGVQLVEVSSSVSGAGRVPLLLGGGRKGGGRMEGAIALPAWTPAQSEIVIDIYYRVIAAGAAQALPRRVELPVLAVLWPPEQAVPGTFRGTVSVHPGLLVRDAFPSDLGRGAGVPDAGGGLRFGFDLPVTPALLAFTLTAGGDGPGLELLLDGLAVLAVAVFGVIGWRRFREEM